MSHAPDRETKYTEPIPDYGDVMTVAAYREACRRRGLIDYDGFGHPARDGKMAGRIDLIPSEPKRIPKDATHVVWFNR